MLYIGESDNVAGRLREHADKSRLDANYFPWWESTLAITSNDDNLTKAHALYLESKLIEKAHRAGLATLANRQGSDRSHTLSRADASDMAVFMVNIEVMLPLLGMELFKIKLQISEQVGEQVSADKSPLFVIKSRDGVYAEAQEIDSEFIMRAGATAKPWHGASGGYQRFQGDLVDKEVLVITANGMLSLTGDYVFSSPSAAAAVILGRASNGRTEWVRKDGMGTYATWQDSEVSSG